MVNKSILLIFIKKLTLKYPFRHFRLDFSAIEAYPYKKD